VRSSRRHPARADWLVALGIALAAPMAAAAEADEPAMQAPSAHARVTFEQVKFPGDERVGFLGTSYLVDLHQLPGVSIGPAVYGAISGERGGLFTIGGEMAWRQRLVGPFGIELGLYAGGGGGGAAPQGGGLMLRPHVDLLMEAGPTAFGVSFSRIKFPNGQIDSTQWGLVLNVNDEFRFTRASSLDTPTRAGGRSGIGFDRIQIVAGAYRARSGATLLDGRPIPTIGLIGVRAEQALGTHAYWGLEANGAAQSTVAGYAEYLGTAGFEAEVLPRLVTLGGRVALGMGGGGGLPVGGGLLAKASFYGVVRLSDNFGLALEAGLADAPRGDFRAGYASAALVWALDGPSVGGVPTRPVRNDFSAGVERYDAARRGRATRTVTTDVLKIERFVASNVYLAGKVESAFAGDAGGYSAALVGAGWWQPLGQKWNLTAELLGGAAGGGGVDSHGAIVQSMLSIGRQFTPALALRVGAGRIQALNGPLGATVVGVSLSFSYGVSSGE